MALLCVTIFVKIKKKTKWWCGSADSRGSWWEDVKLTVVIFQ